MKLATIGRPRVARQPGAFQFTPSTEVAPSKSKLIVVAALTQRGVATSDRRERLSILLERAERVETLRRSPETIPDLSRLISKPQL